MNDVVVNTQKKHCTHFFFNLKFSTDYEPFRSNDSMELLKDNVKPIEIQLNFDGHIRSISFYKI